MSEEANDDIITDPKLIFTEEELVEVLPINKGARITDSNEEEHEFGVELVSMISSIDQKPVTLFENDILVDRVEHENSEEVGKSFRSKDLSQEDLLQPENSLTIEERWIYDDNKTEHSSWIKRLVVIGSVIIMAVGVCAVVNLDKSKDTKIARDKELRELAALSAKSDAELVQKTIGIRQCVKGYIEATIIEDRAKWSRKPIETLEKMTRFYNNKLIFDNYQFEDIAKITELHREGKDLLLVTTKINNLSGERVTEYQSKKLLLEKQSDGTYLVDWETAVGYQPK